MSGADPGVRVVYDHDRVVVVDKDAGVSSEDVAAALGKKLVHRIDRPTSGLLLLADDARTVTRLQRQLRRGDVERSYVVVVHGVVAVGVYDSVLVRDRGDGRRGSRLPGVALASADVGKPARLEVVDVEVFGPLSRATVRLVTGRTHQVRIQLAEAGHVVVGEFVYDRDARARRAALGAALSAAPRLLLHAARLRFTHPGKDKAVVVVDAAVPAVFAEVCAAAARA